MKEVKHNEFYSLIDGFEWVPYTQTLAYNRSIVDENTLHLYIDDETRPTLGCVGYERRKLGIKMLCISGECLLQKDGIERKTYAKFYKELQETGFDIYCLNINTPYNFEAEIALRTAGWLRPVGMFSTELSKIIATDEPLKLDRSWKHNLKKAHQGGLSFSVREIDENTIAEYIANHQELIKRKGFNDTLDATGLAELSRDRRFKMGIVSDAAGKTVAGHIFYKHPVASSSIYAFTSLEGRESGAAFMLYEGILDYLAQEGIATFDVGRLSPAAHKKNNIFLFKDGLGGEYVNYLGEFEFCRNKMMSAALYFMKRHIWKRVRV
jgi:hypothetical protein